MYIVCSVIQMQKEKHIRISITVPNSLWNKFKKKCNSNCKTASGEIHALILAWVKEKKE